MRGIEGDSEFLAYRSRRRQHQEGELLEKEGDKIVSVHVESDVLRGRPGGDDWQVDTHS